MEEQDKRAILAKQKSESELKKIYLEGAKKFEAGEFGKAEKLLTELTSKGDHPFQDPAKKILDEIHRQTDQKLQSRISQAKAKIKAEQLLPAYEELEKLNKQFPQRKDIEELLTQVNQKLLTKAKTFYKEGIAQQELAEDPAVALDKFKEALKYAPDPKSEYHQKALKKIKELELSSEKD